MEVNDSEILLIHGAFYLWHVRFLWRIQKLTNGGAPIFEEFIHTTAGTYMM